MLNDDIIKEAKNWLGVKYEHRGITKQGCDCTGLLIGILKTFGYLAGYKIKRYPNDWNLHAKAGNYIMEEIEGIATKVDIPSIGDLVLFNFGRCISHLGILIENNMFIHTHSNSGICLMSKRVNSSWGKRIVGYYRIDENKLRLYGK